MEEKKKAPAPKRVKKPNMLTRVLALAVTSALVLGALALVVYRDQVNVGALKRWMALRNMQTSDTGEAAPFSHAGGDKLSVAYLDSGVVTASAAGAHYYGLDGGHLAEEVLSVENPVLSASRTTAVAYDAGNQSLFVFRNGEETFTLTLTGGNNLLSARVNDSGWLAVTAQQSGFKGAVTVYNSRGREVITIGLSSVFAVDAAISPDGQSVAVITIGQENGEFFSRLLLYPLDQTEPSLRVELGGLTVLDLDYEEGLLWVLGEDRLLTIPTDGTEKHTYFLTPNYLKGCSLEGEGFALLLTGPYRAGGAAQAVVIDSSAQAIRSIPLAGQVLDYAAAGEYFALLTGSRLTIYSQESEPFAALDNPQAARHVDLAPNGSALLANEQQAWLYIPQ